MTNSFGGRLFSRGVASMMILVGAAQMVGCGSSEAPVAAGPKVEVNAGPKTVGKGKRAVDVESRRSHQQSQTKPAQ